MVDLQDYMCKYMQGQTDHLKGIPCSIIRQQRPIPEPFRLNFVSCWLTRGFFSEEVKVTRDGCNRFKRFYLTAQGKELAQQIKAEGYSDKIPKTRHRPSIKMFF
jgi:hypothetical protein